MSFTKLLFILPFTAIMGYLAMPDPEHAVTISDELFQFGLVADCQYCSDTGTGVRKYSMSEHKLASCVAHLNTMPLKYVMHLGDFIDRDFESFDVVAPIYDRLTMPHYFALGNHDFSVEDNLKEQVPSKLGLESRYYDFSVGSWRFIVLDGNDISFHAYPARSKDYEFAATYYANLGHEEIPKWNGAVGPEQMRWLESTLVRSAAKGEKVVLYCHFPIYPENVHNLWNAGEVVQLIEKFDCVKGYINGHNHAGNYGVKDEIHYLTMKGMVDTEESAYARIQVFPDHLEITGYGREENRTLELR